MGKWYFEILPLILMSVATYLRRRDSNNVGLDDELGKFLGTDVAAIVEASLDGDERGVLRALTAMELSIAAFKRRLEPKTLQIKP